MNLDVLVAEIGSTTTVVNAFKGLDGPEPEFVGQGGAATSVKEGDVRIGLEAAVDDLKNKLGVESLNYDSFMATGSAAGGLKMTVHGLVYDMTARAAKEAALGSGAVLKLCTAGKLRRSDMKKIAEAQPKIILIAGGVDHGERDTALYNYEKIIERFPEIPVLYAGNVDNDEEFELIAEEEGLKVHIAPNVFPQLDQLNIEPARNIIHEIFQDEIVKSPGMEHIRDTVDGRIMPTPGAVMEAAILISEVLPDLLVFDVGGATTDLHSVTAGNPVIAETATTAEPYAKRTVEGDLGVFVNRRHIVEENYSESERNAEIPDFQRFLDNAHEIPDSPEEKDFVLKLTLRACKTALKRHAGQYYNLYGPTGKLTLNKGKDLTAIKYVIGTGGALTRLPGGREILEKALALKSKDALLPVKAPQIFLDNDYIMASLGVLSTKYKDAATKLLLKSLGIKENGEL